MATASTTRVLPDALGHVPGSPEFHAAMLRNPVAAGKWWEFYKSNPADFWRHCVRVKAKTFEFIPFDVDHPDYAGCQNKLLRAVMDQWRIDRRVRVTELKPRQLGSTEFWLNVALWIAIVVVPTSQGIIAADTDPKAEDILQRLKDHVAEMPEWVRPKFDRDAIGRLSFDGWECPDAVPGRPKATSFLLTETSKSKAGGRSYMWNIALFSEAGYYGERCKEFIDGIRMSVSKHAPGMVVLESTAFGWGGEFHQECQRASKKENGYKFIFIPWFQVGEYKMDPRSSDAQRMKRDDFDPVQFCASVDAGDLSLLDDDERDLVQQWQVSSRQLLWRRWCIPANCSSDLDTFHRDFPATPSEAFISSGSPVFDRRALDRNSKLHVRPPLYRGECSVDQYGMPQMRRELHGKVLVWADPIPGRQYILGNDPAAGSENWINPESHVGDNATIQILDRSNREQVAEVAGPWPADVIAEDVLALGLRYNNAMVVVENNAGWGTTVIRRLKQAGYPAIFSREIQDARTHQVSWQYGWCTSPASRPQMFTTARGRVRTGQVIIHSFACIEEMLSMENKFLPSGGYKPQAKGGKKDDRVTNLAMVLQVDQELGDPPPVEEKNPDLIKFDPGNPRSFMWDYINQEIMRPKIEHLM